MKKHLLIFFINIFIVVGCAELKEIKVIKDNEATSTPSEKEVSASSSMSNMIVEPKTKIEPTPSQSPINPLTNKSERIVKVAGNGLPSHKDGSILDSSFNTPLDILIDDFQNLYVADSGNLKVRKVNLNTQEVSTLVGTGKNEYIDGNFQTASFGNFRDMIFTNLNHILVLDFVHGAVRDIDLIRQEVKSLVNISDGSIPNITSMSRLAINSDSNLLISHRSNTPEVFVNTFSVDGKQINQIKLDIKNDPWFLDGSLTDVRAFFVDTEDNVFILGSALTGTNSIFQFFKIGSGGQLSRLEVMNDLSTRDKKFVFNQINKAVLGKNGKIYLTSNNGIIEASFHDENKVGLLLRPVLANKHLIDFFESKPFFESNEFTPWGITVDKNGLIFFTDVENHSIFRLNSQLN